MGIFGYSDEEQRRISELRAAFDKVRASGALADPAFSKLYREDVAAIEAGLARADRGDLDASELTGLEVSVRRLMDAQYERSKDPKLAPDQRPQGGDIEAANAALKTAAAVDRETRAAQQQLAQGVQAIPLEYKIGGALAAVLLLAILLRR